MTDQDIANAVTTALLGQFYVGQRVKVKRHFGGNLAGAQTVIAEIQSKSRVRVEPRLNADGIWHPDWFEPYYD